MNPFAKNQFDIATTIMQQLGGRRFSIMTGANNFMAMEPSNNCYGGLTFMIPRSNNIRAVRVYLLKDDTYKVEFVRVIQNFHTVLKTVEGVYNEQLQEIFTSVTGLYTKL